MMSDDDEEEGDDLDFDNIVHPKKDPSTFHKLNTLDISDNRRPIYGVLTEPLRGNLKNQEHNNH